MMGTGKSAITLWNRHSPLINRYESDQVPSSMFPTRRPGLPLPVLQRNAPPSFSYTFPHKYPTLPTPYMCSSVQCNTKCKPKVRLPCPIGTGHTPRLPATRQHPPLPQPSCAPISTRACMLPRSHEKRQKKTLPANPFPDSRYRIPRLTSTTTVSHWHSPPPPNPAKDGNAQPPGQQ